MNKDRVRSRLYQFAESMDDIIGYVPDVMRPEEEPKYLDKILAELYELRRREELTVCFEWASF